MDAAVWSLWGENIPLVRLQHSGGMMCYAAKWSDSKEVIYRSWHSEDFLSTLWKLLDEADLVISYNGARFDIPRINRELIKNKMSPYSPFKQMDLYKAVKKIMKLPSHKLEFVLEELGLGAKGHTNMELWLKCVQEDPKAWEKMRRYNIKDVVRTEALYRRLSAWLPSPPNIMLEGGKGDPDRPSCPRCGGNHLQSRGTTATTTALYKRWVCKSCKGWSRSRTTEVPRASARHLLVAI